MDILILLVAFFVGFIAGYLAMESFKKIGKTGDEK